MSACMNSSRIVLVCVAQANCKLGTESLWENVYEWMMMEFINSHFLIERIDLLSKKISCKGQSILPWLITLESERPENLHITFKTTQVLDRLDTFKMIWINACFHHLADKQWITWLYRVEQRQPQARHTKNNHLKKTNILITWRLLNLATRTDNTLNPSGSGATRESL